MGKIKLFSIVSLVVLLSACASAPKPLDMSKINSVDISNVHLDAENEIQVNFQQSGSGTAGAVAVGGALGALIGMAIDAGINSNRRKKAEREVAEIRSAMTDFDFRSEVEKRIHQHLRADAFSEALTINHIDKNDPPKDGFIVGGDYQLNDSFSQLKVILSTALFGVEDKPITRQYIVVKNIEGTGEDRGENAKVILSDRTVIVKTLLLQSIDEALIIMNNDYSGEYVYNDESEKVRFSDGTYPLSGRLIEQVGDNSIVGFSHTGLTGIFSVPSETVISKTN